MFDPVVNVNAAVTVGIDALMYCAMLLVPGTPVTEFVVWSEQVYGALVLPD